MTTDELLKKIQSELDSVKEDVHSSEGLLKLQEVAKNYNGEYKLVWSDDLLKELENKPQILATPTGIPKLDSLIKGFRPKQVVTISANSKHGKTSFSLFLMEQLASMTPLMIPLEQSNEELVEQRKENGYSIPRFLSPRRLAARVTIDWVEERIVEGIAKFNSRLIVIDHLGYLDDFGTSDRFARENHAFRIMMLMQGLKTLAKKWDVTILILVHVSQSDEGKPPSLQDLKGSSAILQESDLVLMLWRKNKLQGKIRIYENKTMISVLANRRNGNNGNVGLEFNTKTGRYDESQSWVDSMENQAQLANSMDEV